MLTLIGFKFSDWSKIFERALTDQSKHVFFLTNQILLVFASFPTLATGYTFFGWVLIGSLRSFVVIGQMCSFVLISQPSVDGTL